MISFLKKSLKTYKNLLISSLIFLLLAIYILNQDTGLLFPSLSFERKILSSIVFSPEDSNEKYQVLKIKNKDKILVEIYKVIDQYNYFFVSQIDTGSKYEGYFLLGGNATNLAYINIDDDPVNEIIVPGFDNNLTAHLNVIKFDSSTKTFTLVNQRISLENN